MRRTTPLLIVLILSSPVYAQVFKCIGTDGHTTYSNAPCPFGKGESARLSVPNGSFTIPEGNEVDRTNAVIKWAYQRYPFMNPESGTTNPTAINDALDIRDEAVRNGIDPAQALLDAVMAVGPRYESAELIRRNTESALIMKNSRESGKGTKVTIVGGSADTRLTQARSNIKSRSEYDEYVIEASNNDELFIINGEKYIAQTFCFNWGEGDKVLFLEGSPTGVCTSAKLLNLRLRTDCMVWCE